MKWVKCPQSFSFSSFTPCFFLLLEMYQRVKWPLLHRVDIVTIHTHSHTQCHTHRHTHTDTHQRQMLPVSLRGVRILANQIVGGPRDRWMGGVGVGGEGERKRDGGWGGRVAGCAVLQSI